MWNLSKVRRERLKKLSMAIGMILTLGLLAGPSVKGLAEYTQNALKPGPFGWQDEGYVLEPALNVYQNGLGAFRCRDNIVVCYGSTQVFIDAMILKWLPRSWIHQGELEALPGTRWYYRSELPEAFRALRLSRVVIALALIGTLVGLARMQGWPRGMAFLLGLSFSSSSIFLASRQGLKNDFSAALFCGAFMMSAAWMFRRKYSFIPFLIAIFVGVLGAGVKVSLVLPLAFLFPAFVVLEVLKRVSVRTILLHLGTGVFLALGLYYALNPNLSVNSSEATWFLSFFISSGSAFTWDHFFSELWTLGAVSSWILLIPIALSFRQFRKLPPLERLEQSYFVGVGVLILLLLAKGGMGRPHYYLFVLGWSYFAAVLCWPIFRAHFEKKAVFSLLLGGALLGVSWVDRGFGLSDWATFSFPQRVEAKDPFQVLVNRSEELNSIKVFDLALHPPLEKGRWDPKRVMFFDSLSEGPSEVVRRAEAKLKADFPSENPGRVKVWVSCWSPDTSAIHDREDLLSPAALAWARVTQSFCKHLEPLTYQQVYHFENGYRPKDFAQISLAQIRSTGPMGILFLPDHQLSPRFLKGAIDGLDYWYSPLVLYQDTHLEGEFASKRPITSLRLPFESTCKGPGKVEVRVKSGTTADHCIESRVETALDIQNQLCQRRPLICRLGLMNWWMERFPHEARIEGLKFAPGEPFHLSIRAQGLDRDRCRVSLKMIEMGG